jgi:phosphoglycerol transferase MdoB-like AlkP superfamily enzyme
MSTDLSNRGSVFPWARWRPLLLSFLVHCSVYMSFRLVFYGLNLGPHLSVSDPEVVQAFVYGLRFDICAILLLGLPHFLFLYFRVPNQFFLRKLALWFGIVPLWFAIVFNTMDAEYFKFSGKRSGLEVFSFWNDAAQQSLQLVVQYWYLWCFVVVTSGLSFYFLRGIVLKIQAGNHSSIQSKKDGLKIRLLTGEVLSFVVLVALIFFGIRGGLQRKPLEQVHAFVFDRNELNFLALNASFTLLKSDHGERLTDRNDFSSSTQALSALRSFDPLLLPSWEPLGQPYNVNPGYSDPKTTPFNVVVLIVESLAREYMGYGNTYPGFTPFVDSLIPKGLFFPNAFANGRRSIDAAWSIGTGVPGLLDSPIPTGPYRGVNFSGIGQYAGSVGHRSLFFHGGKNGTMYFDYLARRAGYDEYFGMSEYPLEKRSADFDGSWGIFDGPFLKFMIEKLDDVAKKKQNFVSTLFTVTSHNPYPLPEEFRKKSGKIGTHPMHMSIRYADESLKEFFETAATKHWYRNTLFLITGDHTAYTREPKYQNDLGYYRIPLLLYSPALQFDKSYERKIVEHADVSCTVGEFIGARVQELGVSPFCESVLSDFPGQAILQSSGHFTVITPFFWLRSSADGKNKVFPISYPGGLNHEANELKGQNNIREALDKKRRAAVQLFNNGLNSNQFSH